MMLNLQIVTVSEQPLGPESDILGAAQGKLRGCLNEDQQSRRPIFRSHGPPVNRHWRFTATIAGLISSLIT